MLIFNQKIQISQQIHQIVQSQHNFLIEIKQKSIILKIAYIIAFIIFNLSKSLFNCINQQLNLKGLSLNQFNIELIISEINQNSINQKNTHFTNNSQFMNSHRSSIVNNSSCVSKAVQRTTRSKPLNLTKIRQKLNLKLASKYCTCENYITINQINRTLADKECILKTTINDIKYNLEDQKLEQYYLRQKSQHQLPQLIEYYKYYSQKSVLFIKQYFPLLYQYQQKRKVIQYNRLKVLLNLSDSSDKKLNQSNKKIKESNQSISDMNNKSRIGISRNYIFAQKQPKKLKGYKGINILHQLQQTQNSTHNANQQSLLINRLRNNLSKHIGPSQAKHLSIEELDKAYNFTKKNDVFHTFKQSQNFFLLPTGKSKNNPLKNTKFSRQQTHTTTPQQFKNSKTNIRRRSAKRNNSCQNLTRVTVTKSPYECTTTKLRRKKNLSMDNIYTHTSTPYMPEEKNLPGTKMKKINIKTGERCIRQKQNVGGLKGPQIFLQSISDLKNKIKRQKQRLLNKLQQCIKLQEIESAIQFNKHSKPTIYKKELLETSIKNSKQFHLIKGSDKRNGTKISKNKDKNFKQLVRIDKYQNIITMILNDIQ